MIKILESGGGGAAAAAVSVNTLNIIQVNLILIEISETANCDVF